MQHIWLKCITEKFINWYFKCMLKCLVQAGWINNSELNPKHAFHQGSAHAQDRGCCKRVVDSGAGLDGLLA